MAYHFYMVVFAWIALMIQPALAWENHQTLMERILDSKSSKQRIYPYQKIEYPCGDEEKSELAKLAKEIQIDATKVPLYSEKHCGPGQKSGEVFISDLLVSNMVDEPDFGMDQNLPDSADPSHFRKWMGGATGPTSQGFRHMYFSGVQLKHPLDTFQIPLGAVGEALERIQILKAVSQRYFSEGKKFWGIRTLLWELHYIQDLNQPFHVVQVPSLRLLPWKKIFPHFIQASTHAIANYHYAYEALALGMAKEAVSTDFQKCFEPEQLEDPTLTPELIEAPRNAAIKIGSALYAVLGEYLKTDQVNLPDGVGQIDTFSLLHASEPVIPAEQDQKEISPDELAALRNQLKQFKGMAELKKVTCGLMGSVARTTWYELDHSFIKPPQGSSSNKSGKWSDALPEIRRVKR